MTTPKGDTRMKHFYIFTSLILAAAMLSSCTAENKAPAAGTETTAGITTTTPVTEKLTSKPAKTTREVIFDEIFYHGEENAELAVFRVGKLYLSYTEKYPWVRIEDDMTKYIDIPDGGFAIINADITRLDGGEAGYGGEPVINKFISWEKTDLSYMVEHCGIENYRSGKTVYNIPFICGNYIVIDLYGTYYVYRDGQAVGTYDTSLEAEAAMGFTELVDDSAEYEYKNGVTMYVLRCEDKYYTMTQSIFMNDYWTPLLNTRLENIPTGFTLEDGELVKITGADIIKVNGGKRNYVNAPILTYYRECEKCSFYDVSKYASVGFWEEGESEDNVREDGEYVFRGVAVFELEDTLLVYRCDGEEHEFFGYFDSPGDIDAALGIQ